jgi:hypothetical protein
MTHAILTAALVAGAPVLMVLHAFVMGMVKDGSPLHRDWWTAGPREVATDDLTRRMLVGRGGE